ncbi:4-phosphopantetheinyl transferase [Blastococcus sp. TF02-8]|uniref:4'-phosphopantetheinyl transferase family protein n=1 Tax=Blastococcus sp. TF02-8 TaxID=2250574 RepID=UPI000DEA7393|nr:4'-phosphopantetheinyl transferase superfamily protein [Blastococcus sp. TF02-8]RBY96236.1 4-phosphopantetheinyl transferase [Blastococcus sp. TF02-8]
MATSGAVLGEASPVEGAQLRLWWVRLDRDAAAVAEAERCLTADERARAHRGVPVVHRRRVLLRAALRRALAEVLDREPSAVRLGTSGRGRPEALDRDDVDVSCSASGALGLVAVATALRVGVDVEALDAWSPDVLHEPWLTPAERRAVLDLPPAARPAALARSWTQKEAVLKGRGVGLAGDPASVGTPVGEPRGGRLGRWDVSALEAPGGWVASIATCADLARSVPAPATPVPGPRPLALCEAFR